jgi:hypothetical protein
MALFVFRGLGHWLRKKGIDGFKMQGLTVQQNGLTTIRQRIAIETRPRVDGPTQT